MKSNSDIPGFLKMGCDLIEGQDLEYLVTFEGLMVSWGWLMVYLNILVRAGQLPRR